MYEIFEKLLISHGITAYRVAKDTGISTGSLSDWKNGRSSPKAEKLQIIADYFGVTVDYLLTGEKKTPADMTEVEEMVEALKFNPGMRVLFSKTKHATKEDIEKVIKMIDIMKGNDNYD